MPDRAGRPVCGDPDAIVMLILKLPFLLILGAFLLWRDRRREH